MDALFLLKNDHDKLRRLLGELESSTDRGVRTRMELFAAIKAELTVHESIEEEIFYPALMEMARAKDISLEAYEEHHVVDLLLVELEDLDVADERWLAKAQVMKESIERHIGEEEGGMFAKTRQVFDRTELDELGSRMAASKAELARDMGLPIPMSAG